jgi:hypothetical protein
MFDEPITTIQQAKDFFRAMGCSHFHMDREYPGRANEYRRLHISKQTEKEWMQEQFDEYYVSIVENTNSVPLWSLHSSMYDLLLSIKTDAALLKMLEVTRQMRDKVPMKDRIIVAETINGRTVRSARQGLIYVSYDWSKIPAAKEFVDLSLHFSQYDEKENRGFERCQKAIKLCNDIKLELGL